MWDQLIHNAQSLQGEDEWLVIGDFNQTLSNKDKLSFKTTFSRGAQNLQTFLDQCFLSKIKPNGQYMT